MIALLDSIGPAIWRASWQATLLAMAVVVVLRLFGERLTPRWRFLFWSVVLMRLLLVATVVSPTSAFNLFCWSPAVRDLSIAQHRLITTVEPVSGTPHPTDGPHTMNAELPPVRDVSQYASSPPTAPAELNAIAVTAADVSSRSSRGLLDVVVMGRVLSVVWLVGSLLLGLKLVGTAIVLRRRLSVCRPVTDAAILDLLETCRNRIGLSRPPVVLVTPENFSPCIAGIMNPRIILPESIVAESTDRLRHVLAHELAHLKRCDLWTNWLMLTARVLHWFNPVAWWTVRQMQAEREAACDELAFAALGAIDRSAYAATIIDLAANLSPMALVPGLVGLFSPTCHLQARIERLLSARTVPALGPVTAALLLIGVALTGLTDAMPVARAQQSKLSPSSEQNEQRTDKYTFSGRCIDHGDRKPMAGVTVRLYRLTGRTAPPVEVAKTVSADDGHFEFTGLVPPGPDDYLGPMTYTVFGFADNRPIGDGFRSSLGHHDKDADEIWMSREKSTLSGKAIDSAGRPVVGAKVQTFSKDGRLIPGLPFASTDKNGRFRLDNVPVYQMQGGTVWETHFTVVHPDYPQTWNNVAALPADIVVTLPVGCVVTGSVTDSVTNQPGAEAVVMAERIDVWKQTFVATDAEGRFRIVLPEGQYNFLVQSPDRVCVALTGRECLPDERIELPPFALIRGGRISGQVFNTVTGESVSVTNAAEPVMLGLYGPSRPLGPVISPDRMAAVDKTGRYSLPAAPGDNFPYFVNIQGVRMAWDTKNQPPVIVKDGETTNYNMLIKPEIPPHERLKAARKLVEALSEDKLDRTAQILLEFKKLNDTVDQTELWCLLMREMVAVGPDAVPQLCAELDQTIENRMMRRMGFALRAIGDARAVPALIRAIPKTLLPSSSDYGLIVEDKELTDFMQTHHSDGKKGGTYFSLGRPEREIFGALHILTKKNFDDDVLFGISLSEDPRRQVLQRRLYGRQAKRWQTWWEANWSDFTGDPAYKKVTLVVTDEVLPDAPRTLDRTARLVGEVNGAVLSPPSETGQYVSHFYDLDTGYQPRWPHDIPRKESPNDAKKLTDWAADSGADLMCVSHRSANGTETYTLRPLGMKVREIDARDMRNLGKLIAAGTPPEGRPVGELLMHFDAISQNLVPDANGFFLFTTREGNMGVIETTGRVTRTADLTGQPAIANSDIGFHKGVRFNLTAIVP